MLAEKRELEERLANLRRGLAEKPKTARAGSSPQRRTRKYPPVLPKYQNPSDPSETWAGRGKQPRWLVAQLTTGRKLGEFLINRDERKAVSNRPSA